MHFLLNMIKSQTDLTDFHTLSYASTSEILSLPFHIYLNLAKSTPFLAESSYIGHYREYAPPPPLPSMMGGNRVLSVLLFHYISVKLSCAFSCKLIYQRSAFGRLEEAF